MRRQVIVECFRLVGLVVRRKEIAKAHGLVTFLAFRVQLSEVCACRTNLVGRLAVQMLLPLIANVTDVDGSRGVSRKTSSGTERSHGTGKRRGVQRERVARLGKRPRTARSDRDAVPDGVVLLKAGLALAVLQQILTVSRKIRPARRTFSQPVTVHL